MEWKGVSVENVMREPLAKQCCHANSVVSALVLVMLLYILLPSAAWPSCKKGV